MIRKPCYRRRFRPASCIKGKKKSNADCLTCSWKESRFFCKQCDYRQIYFWRFKNKCTILLKVIKTFNINKKNTLRYCSKNCIYVLVARQRKLDCTVVWKTPSDSVACRSTFSINNLKWRFSVWPYRSLTSLWKTFGPFLQRCFSSLMFADLYLNPGFG